MADNIKIVGEILNTQEVSRYDDADVKLLTSQTIRENFGQTNDYIEYYVYDIGGNVLNTNYSYKNFKLPVDSNLVPEISSSLDVNNSIPSTNIGIESNTVTSSYFPIIEIDPVKDLQNLGYTSGEFKVQYNFFNNKLSNPSAELFLKEISSDRTELRVGSTVLTNEQIESGSITLINEYTGSAYFVDYVLNFGNNDQVLAVNVALNKVPTGYEILFKLYQPLPDNIQEKDSLWVVKEKINPFIFDINLDTLISPPPLPQLRGPNFNINIVDENDVGTPYQTYNSLINSVQNVSTSSYQQLLSLLTSQSIDINVDYSNYSNFVFFSSAKERVLNFYTKVKQIEGYNNDIALYNASTSSLKTQLTNNSTSSIDSIISNFDGFEYYLYFQSGSITPSTAYGINPYPKSGSLLPYTLYSTGSSLVTNWLTAATASAELWDNDNQNYIVNTLPAFIIDDDNNSQYITFVNMIGHYFDNIWIYLQAVTDINLANNNLDQGVSKDLVYYVLQSLGTKLYNQYGDVDNVSFLVGNSGSAIFDNNFTSTGSYLNTIPKKDLLAESYKRIYHNLPLLLKTKGTTYGLQTLISAFGITSSILPVKEYGGYLKSDTLDEFNSDKIRVVPNNLTGSVLSPYISLQNQPTSSTAFRTNDLHYVDISFSPQDKIDLFTSSSISTTNPTWNLDNYIGDPRQQYSTTYLDLDEQKSTYYSPLTASVIPFTSSISNGLISATDYNSFIRLFQYFDNSLFKMLSDYMPARTSLSTGITITSPLLERNKVQNANPSVSSLLSPYDANIASESNTLVTMSVVYGNDYKKQPGNKSAFYTGDFSGSFIDVYQYFEDQNVNPYLYTFNQWNSQHPSESINMNKFYHSDFNVLFNNVSSSLISRVRQDVEYIFGTTQSILSPAYLQDSYESLKTHQLSRYEGVKIYSLKYNNYTSASSTYGGDLSFGKSAVVDRNSVKLGLFTEITTNKFLPKRNNAVLKYLVDIDGNLTELNLRNKHWEEIQNMFVLSNTSSISLFNNQLYSNQKTTDGQKVIFDSGYNYAPLLYFSSGSSDPSISFQNQGDTSAYLATAKNSISSPYASGSGTIGYPIVSQYIANIFNTQIQDDNNIFTPGALNSFPTYSVSEAGSYQFYANIDVAISSPLSSNSVTWSLELWNGASKIEENIVSASIGTSVTSNCYAYSYTGYSGGTIYWTNCDGTAGSAYVNPSTPYSIPCARPGSLSGFGPFTQGASCGTFTTTGAGTATLPLTINKGYSGNSNYLSLASGDKLHVKLKVVGVDNNNFTASLSEGSLTIGSLAQSTGYSVISFLPNGYFNAAAINAASSSIVFNSTISSFYNNNYLFAPNPTSGSANSLYDTYGDVDYLFNPKKNDVIVLYLKDNTIVEFTITNVIMDNVTGLLTLIVDRPLSDGAKLNLTNTSTNQLKRFLLLSRISDETNVILSFIRREGKTSYGFLIPEDISGDVIDNIDVITKEVKQKLLNDQSIINDINGGTF
jgi:hypothetical protein